MRVFGYIFLAQDKHHLVPEITQKQALWEYGRSLGLSVEEIIVEDAAPLKRPFKDRPAGSKLLQRCESGDTIIIMKAEWAIGSAGDGQRLLALLKSAQIAFYCIDLGGNISIPEKRRLMVSEGPAAVVEKLLAALTVSEISRHGQAIRTAKKHRKEMGKYLGGPVPFGWEVNREGYLVPNEEQQRIIGSIVDMRRDRWSYREISQKLKEEYKVRLSHEGVRRIFKSDRRD
ncbi:MAG: recombinase family protein [Proteobacteria bacterium]|nr:recombinase family protein [Pseudomonadota bacterium]